MPERRAIDMRVRPPAPGFETLALYWDKPRIIGMGRDIGFEPAPSYIEHSLIQCLAEMAAAGIVLGVITGRMAGQRLGRVSNTAIAELVSRHPDRFIGYGGVDTADVTASRTEIRRILEDERFKGVVVESGCADDPKYADDPSLSPIFADCEDAGIPVLLMAGGNAGPDLMFSHPVQIDRIAARHPKLQIIAAHGSWPWITEILGVAFRRANVWVSPDMYLFLPGGQLYVEAANGYLQDRFLFGTAYPALPFQETVERFCGLSFSDKVLDKVLFRNAARLLGMGPA